MNWDVAAVVVVAGCSKHRLGSIKEEADEDWLMLASEFRSNPSRLAA
jgi:hypothetical protein